MSTPSPTSGTPEPYQTEIERRLQLAARELNDPLDAFTVPAWYFVANFSNLDNGRPVGALMRYEAGDLPFRPSISTPIVGDIVGDVRFENGRAYFDGNGYLKFQVTDQHIQALDRAKLDAALASPKPLSMVGYGHADAVPANEPGQPNELNPALYYTTGTSKFGLFARPDMLASKINLEAPQTDISAQVIPTPAIWFAYVSQQLDDDTSGAQYRFRLETVDPDHILEHLTRQEFALFDRFQMQLEPGSVFYVGATPPEGTQARFHGWLEEVIFDPTGGTNGPRAGM